MWRTSPPVWPQSLLKSLTLFPFPSNPNQSTRRQPR